MEKKAKWHHSQIHKRSEVGVWGTLKMSLRSWLLHWLVGLVMTSLAREKVEEKDEICTGVIKVERKLLNEFGFTGD